MLQKYSLCWLALLVCANPLRADDLYFFPQTNVVGEVDCDWFNGDNWFIYDVLGSLVPAGAPPRDEERGIVTGLADVGSNLVRLGGLVLTNGATVTNGTFGLGDIVMAAGSSFRNTRVNLMGTLNVQGPECTFSGGILRVLSSAAAVVKPGAGAKVAELWLANGATVQVDGRVYLRQNASLRGGPPPESVVQIHAMGLLSSEGTNFIRGAVPTVLRIDHSGVIESSSGSLQLQDGLKWVSSGGVNYFRAAGAGAYLEFTGAFQVPASVLSVFTGPGLTRFLAGAEVNGTLRAGPDPVARVEVVGPVSGSGVVECLSVAAPGSWLDWRGGLFSCRRLDIGPGSGLNITGSGEEVREFSGCTLSNRGLSVLTAPALRLSSGSLVTNLGDFELQGPAVLLAQNGSADGKFANGGTVRKVTGARVSFGRPGDPVASALELHNGGRIEVVEGELLLGEGESGGEFGSAEGASLRFWTGLHTFSSGVRFSGLGRVQVADDVQNPRWKVTGDASLERLELGTNSLVEGSLGAVASVIAVGELSVTAGALLTNTSLVVEHANLSGASRFRDSVVDITQTASILGSDHLLDGSGLNFGGGAAAVMAENSLVQLSNGAEITCPGKLSMNAGATVQGMGMPGGRLFLSPGGALEVLDSADLAATDSGGLILDNSGLIIVLRGALRIASTVDVRSTAGAGAFFLESPGAVSWQSPFVLKAGVTYVLMGPGTHSFPASATVSGSVQVGGRHPATGLFTPGRLLLTNDLTGSGVLSVNGTNVIGSVVEWHAGTVSLAQIRVSPGAVFQALAPTGRLAGCMLQNAGLLEIRSREWRLQQSALVKNEPGGTLECHEDIMFLSEPLPLRGSVTNAGLLRKLEPGVVQFGAQAFEAPAFYNSGLVDLSAGELRLGPGGASGEFRSAADTTLSFWCGSYSANSGTRFTGPGLVKVQGALRPAALQVQAPVSLNNLELGNDGSLGGPGLCTVHGTFLWSGGSLEGAGAVAIASSAKGTMSGTGGRTWNSRRIQNAGTLNWDSETEVLAGGGAVLENLPGGLLILAGNGRFAASGVGLRPAIRNAGSVRKLGSGAVFESEADLANTGMTEIVAGTLKVSGAWTQTAGETSVASGAFLSTGTLELLGGVLSGAGTVDASVENGAVVSPGPGTGELRFSAGSAYQQLAQGRLLIEMSGQSAPAMDRLMVPGSAALGGVLELRLQNGWMPSVGEPFTVLQTGSLLGTFSAIQAPAPEGTTWVARYTPTNVIVSLALSSRLESPAVRQGQFEFSFSTLPGTTYSVQRSESLSPAQWQTFTNVVGDGSRRAVFDPVTAPQRFYRTVYQ